VAGAPEWQAKTSVGTDPEIVRLRTALRDLVALSTVPAAWVWREPPAIAAPDLSTYWSSRCTLDFAYFLFRKVSYTSLRPRERLRLDNSLGTLD
jgi:hypothetical protein